MPVSSDRLRQLRPNGTGESLTALYRRRKRRRKPSPPRVSVARWAVAGVPRPLQKTVPHYLGYAVTTNNGIKIDCFVRTNLKNVDNFYEFNE